MRQFVIKCLRIIALIIVLMLIAAYFYGLMGMLMTLCVSLSVWLGVQLTQTAQLYGWLARPKLSTVPVGVGIWREIFSALLRQSKSRKKRKQKINAALQRFYQLSEAMPNGVMVLSRDGRIEWMNQLARVYLGLKPEDTQGILRHLVREPAFLEFLDDLNAKAGTELTFRLERDRFQPRMLGLHGSALDGGRYLIVIDDVTVNEMLHAARTDFVANVSHELRTPLTVVNGFLETLVDNPDIPREQQLKFMGLMQKEGARMLALLNDLLTLSRLESQDALSEPSDVNLSLLVEQVANDTQAFSHNRHNFSIDVAPNVHIQGIYADLYSALSNLTFNAVRYTPQNGEIAISLKEISSNHYRFSVRDNGPGIAPEHLPRLTERFYRVDSGRSRSMGGTGLGLSITKHALALHQSRLTIESTVGQGSEFSADFSNEPIVAAGRLTGANTHALSGSLKSS